MPRLAGSGPRATPLGSEAEKQEVRKQDLLLAPLGEALLILVAGMAGWPTHQPMLFASLGPTAYELIETPHRRSARPYSIILGHSVGLVAAILALGVTAAWKAPAATVAPVPVIRIWSAALASALTVLGTLALRAGQPAAISTTLLVALGLMQTPRDILIIFGSVLLVTAAGEPLRRWRLRMSTPRLRARLEP